MEPEVQVSNRGGKSRNEADWNTFTEYGWVWLSRQEERNEHLTAENASEEQQRMGTKLLEASFCSQYRDFLSYVSCWAPRVLHYNFLSSQWNTIHLLQVLLHQSLSLPSLSHPTWCIYEGNNGNSTGAESGTSKEWRCCSEPHHFYRHADGNSDKMRCSALRIRKIYWRK